MAVGMGIHGEPGIDERDIPSSHELAEYMVSSLLSAGPVELPADGRARVALILNGLGSVKYEELFVTYRSVASILFAKGIEIVQPDVGELVTSFEMAGISLTLLWLDDELEQAWSSPAYTPAYKKGMVTPRESMAIVDEEETETAPIPESTEVSRTAGMCILKCLDAMKSVISDNVDELGRLDSIAGDGDHGIGMQRGVTAAVTAAQMVAERGAGAGTILNTAGDAWADRGGGTSGALWGLALREVAGTLGDTAVPTAKAIVAGVTSARDAIGRFGEARLGDKTMLDAFFPFVDALTGQTKAGASIADAWTAASVEATKAAASTSDLLPKMGRARPHREKSLGTPDPGAVSLALTMDAIARVLKTTQGETE